MNVCPPIVTVALRSAPEFGATLKAMVPLPLPVAGEVIVIHGASAVAVQLHPGSEAVIDTVPLPPAAVKAWLVGEIENVHGAAAWLTVNVCPAIVTVPLRAAPVVAATLSPTVPAPVPAPPAVTVIHGAFDADVQLHPSPADTDTEADPPLAGIGWDVGAIVYAQACAGAD